MQIFNKEDGFNRNEDHADMDQYTDEEDMKYVRLNNKRERHWRMVFEEIDGRMDNQKVIIHAKRWDIYKNRKNVLIKDGCSAEEGSFGSGR